MTLVPSGTGERAIGVLLVLASTAAFAVGPTAARVAQDDGANTPTVVVLRGAVAAALMALLVLATRKGFRMGRAAWRWSLWCGVFQAVAIYGFIGAVAAVPVGVAVLVFFTHPLLVAVVAHRYGGERLTARKLLLAVVAFAGLGMALGPEAGALDPSGVALAALASLAMCGVVLCTGRAQERATSAQVNLHATAAGTLAIALLTTALGGWALPSNTAGWLGVLGAGVGICIGLLAFFAGLRRLGPARATMLSSVEPLVNILFAAAVLGERL
ncbi:MAG: DMT family transporter, partial [Acetobacteraceae bacterium]|nr:DMT family transporter [Acetobacteraceae bacterium]